jgi:hypothetical protein
LPTIRHFKDIILIFFINSGRIHSPENPKAEIAAFKINHLSDEKNSIPSNSWFVRSDGLLQRA